MHLVIRKEIGIRLSLPNASVFQPIRRFNFQLRFFSTEETGADELFGEIQYALYLISC